MSSSLAKLFLDDFSRAPAQCEEYIKEMEPFIIKGKRENLIKSVEIMKKTQKRAEIIASDILAALVILGKREDTKS